MANGRPSSPRLLAQSSASMVPHKLPERRSCWTDPLSRIRASCGETGCRWLDGRLHHRARVATGITLCPLPREMHHTETGIVDPVSQECAQDDGLRKIVSHCRDVAASKLE